jgi:hypothetical protein
MSSQWTVADSYPNLLTYFLNKIFNFLLWHAGMDNFSDEAKGGAGPGEGCKNTAIFFGFVGVPDAPKNSTPLHSPIIFFSFFGSKNWLNLAQIKGQEKSIQIYLH